MQQATEINVFDCVEVEQDDVANAHPSNRLGHDTPHTACADNSNVQPRQVCLLVRPPRGESSRQSPTELRDRN